MKDDLTRRRSVNERFGFGKPGIDRARATFLTRRQLRCVDRRLDISQASSGMFLMVVMVVMMVMSMVVRIWERMFSVMIFARDDEVDEGRGDPALDNALAFDRPTAYGDRV